MAKEGVFIGVFAKAHPKFGVPLNAILLQSVWAIVLVFYWGKFESLYTYVTITEWFFLLLTCIGFVLMVYRQKMLGSLRLIVFSVLALLFSAVVIWFISKNALSDDPAAYFGLLVIPVGVVFYYIFKNRN